MKVIFLDIDGVVNCEHTKEMFNHYTFVEDKKVEMIKQIVDATGAKIVLSSTWRFGWEEDDTCCQLYLEFDALRKKFKEFGMEFISKTPIDSRGYRGNEIKEWLQNWKGENIESFIILDDDNDMKPFGSRLIQTSWMKGIQEKHIKKAIKMLGEKVEWKAL